MNILLSGATGFIGTALVSKLSKQHSLYVLTREEIESSPLPGVQTLSWAQLDASANHPSYDAVINLAGKNISDARWTKKEKALLLSSRIEPLQKLHAYFTAVGKWPKRFISCSAVGYYGSQGDTLLTETAPPGSGFLPELCQKWENEAHHFKNSEVHILRFGVVIGKNGGMLKKILPAFKWGVGGKIGDGQQWLSWISLNDITRAIEWSLSQGKAGTTIVSSPEPVKNETFTEILAYALHRPAMVSVPRTLLHTLFGEMADEALLASQRAIPQKLLASGFIFEQPHLKEAIHLALSP